MPLFNLRFIYRFMYFVYLKLALGVLQDKWAGFTDI